MNSQSKSDDRQDFGEKNFSHRRKEKSSKRKPWWRNYRWRMRHYFYVHVLIFVLEGLFGGLVVFLIERHIHPNPLIFVEFIDAWFVASSCVYSCGLTTLDFARLSVGSQVILMLLTVISGITISTLPALIIKARTHKSAEGPRVDDDHSAFRVRCVSEKKSDCSPEAAKKISQLPTAEQLRYRAYLTCLALIPLTCFSIYIVCFLAIGTRISTNYNPLHLLQDGKPVNPWYASFLITVTGFNQNGLTPWSDGLLRFVDDALLNIFIMLLVMSGTSFFPFIFRNVISLCRWLAPWHNKVIFDYILLNNHRLSTVIFPTIQTRIYLIVTFALYTLGIGISMALDYNSTSFAIYPPGLRILIFFFQTISSRFAGFQTIDLMLFNEATLVVYLLLMAAKPQMLCALDKSPFEVEWHTLREGRKLFIEEPKRRLSATSIDSSNTSDIYPVQRLHRALRSRSLDARLRAERYFASITRRATDIKSNKKASLKLRLLVLLVTRRLLSHGFALLSRTRTWLFIFIVLVCAFESDRIGPQDPDVTFLKIVFEVVSAFGAVGLTMGYPNVTSSFSTVLTRTSKVVLLFTMLMGRHRGLLESMKDQEKIEYSAQVLLERWQKLARNEYPLFTGTSTNGSAPVISPRTIFSSSRPKYNLEQPTSSHLSRIDQSISSKSFYQQRDFA